MAFESTLIGGGAFFRAVASRSQGCGAFFGPMHTFDPARLLAGVIGRSNHSLIGCRGAWVPEGASCAVAEGDGRLRVGASQHP